MTPAERLSRVMARLACFLATIASAGGYIEVLEESRCHDGRFLLTCRHLDAHLAILEAAFTPSGAPPPLPPPLPPDAAARAAACAANASDPFAATAPSADAAPRRYPLRPALNHRCSGIHHCNFILSEDIPGASLWGPGLVYIKYACMKGANASRWCERREAVTARGEAFLQTPGYPQFYVGERRCLWELRAPPGQRLALRLLDVSLREISKPSENCTDWLKVSEEGRELLNVCGEQEDLIEVTSEGNSLDVTILIGSKTLFPRRGVLLHYKALDCVHPPPPTDGYIVYRNDTYGEYMCCLDFVFPDTHNRHRVLQCVNNNTWNDSLPNCIQYFGMIDDSYNVIGPMRLNSDANSTVYASVLNHSDLLLDVLLPTVIICILLVGNSVILFVIYYLRKRRLSRNSEEAGAICQPHEATD